MSSENNSTPNKFKKRKRKTFLVNARKYAKKGHYGRGARMESDVYDYFIRTMEVFRAGFETEEDKRLFVNNVFEQTEHKEVEYSCNQVGSRIIQTLLPFANESVFNRFCQAFSEDLRPLCTDQYATHVLETLVRESSKKSLQVDTDNKEHVFYHEFTVKISKYMLNNIEDFIWDTYGNHVMRTCLQSLAQLPKEVKNQAKSAESAVETDLPSDYLDVVKDYGGRIIVWPQFNEMCHTELTSGFLQILLQALKKSDKNILKRYVEKLLDEILAPKQENDNLPVAFSSISLIMLLETSIIVAKKKMFNNIYERCFKGRLSKLVSMKSTNFAVQKLISRCKEKETFEAIFDELKDHFGVIIEAGFGGIIQSLGEGCKRLSTRQGLFVQSLMTSLNCAEPEDNQKYFVLCMCRFKNLEETKKMPTDSLEKDKLNLHGTLTIQLMLEFNKPIKIVNSILNMDGNELKNLFLNTMGSHIVDSFVTSAFVGEKSREKLVRKMKGYYQDLASSKYGSRSFEALWNSANFKSRLQIMDELAYKEAAWSNTMFGHIISCKVNLVLYKRNQEEWKNSLNKSLNKVEEAFTDILK